MSFWPLLCLFWLIFFPMAMAIKDVRNMTIEEYINYINPPAVYKYQNEGGETILCADQNHSTMNISYSGLENRCPAGTVSFREIKYETVKAFGSVADFLNSKASSKCAHEYAIQSLRSNDPIYSAEATFNVWRPHVSGDDAFSLSQIWVVHNGPPVEAVEAGWEVYPAIYGNSEPRLFVYWTADGYQTTGCSNTRCRGFEAVEGARYEVGQILFPPSQYGSLPQNEININIEKGMIAGQVVWKLYVEGGLSGYWPTSLFKNLAKSANRVDYGGEVCIRKDGKGTPHSRTDMGSGRFPSHNPPYTHVAYVRGIELYGPDGEEVEKHRRWVDASKPKCYNVRLFYGKEWGHYMYFGGPGGDDPGCVN